MDTRQLARMDLNLLVAFQVLLEERHVSRAADRLFITQSAMSKTLGRLRDLFDDPLFTRSSHGMVPTPRALELQSQVQGVLSQVQSITTGQQFDPKTYEGEISIAVSEYVGVVLLPALMQLLQQEAPLLRVTTLSRVELQLDELTDGGLDFAIHVRRSHYRPEFNLKNLGSTKPVLLVRKGHPLWRQRKPDWKDISQYPRVALYMPNVEEMELIDQVGEVFYQMEHDMREVFETSHLYTAMEVVRRTDCIMMGPPFLTDFAQFGGGLMSLPIPTHQEVQINYVLVSHKRTENSPLHSWLAEKIVGLSQLFNVEPEEDDNPYSAFGRAGQRGRWTRS